MFIFLDTDLKIDKPQSNVADRPRQDRAARPEDERRRRRARRHAGRRLRQLFQHRRTLLQGDPAGAAALPPQCRAAARLLHPRRRRRARCRCRPSRRSSTKTVPQSLNHFQQLNSATIQGVAMPGVAQGDALAVPAGPRGAHAAAGLLGRLRRPVAAVRAGIERLRHHFRLRADHHLPRARRAVRELPRSA